MVASKASKTQNVKAKEEKKEKTADESVIIITKLFKKNHKIFNIFLNVNSLNPLKLKPD